MADNTAVFDYFFRKLPFGGGYAIFAGLQDLLDALESMRFSDDELNFLREKGFHGQFLDYLKGFKFTGSIYASKEGDVIFPIRPVLSIEANILEAQIIETLVLNILNFQTLVAIKASRIRHIAGDVELVDFGLRRAQSAAGYHASRASIIGGFNATSNVKAAEDYNIPVSGTMSHSFVQSYDSERQAFSDFSDIWPDRCILLLDTYSTLESGVPNAIRVAKEMERRGRHLQGVRLDSGDLGYLAKETRKLLDEAGLPYVKIAASNELDEFRIQELKAHDAPIDIFGVGTNLVIGQEDGALDGVYKLAYAGNKSRIKLSESVGKVTLPAKKQVYRGIDEHGNFSGIDVIALFDQKNVEEVFDTLDTDKQLDLNFTHKEQLLEPVIVNGQSSHQTTTLKEIASYSKERLALLPDEYKQLTPSKKYNIGISGALKDIRQTLINEYTKR